MKCAACGYEKRNEQYTADKVTRFKRGKREGEIKKVETVVIEPDRNKEDFIRIYPVGQDQDFYVRGDSYYGDSFSSRTLYACPECGTVRMEHY